MVLFLSNMRFESLLFNVTVVNLQAWAAVQITYRCPNDPGSVFCKLLLRSLSGPKIRLFFRYLTLFLTSSVNGLWWLSLLQGFVSPGLPRDL